MKIKLSVCATVLFAGVTGIVANADTSAFEPPAHQKRADILWTKTICREDGRYIGWPSVCRLKSGKIIAVFSGDRDWHVCPYGKVQMVESVDEGETWSAPRTIANGLIDDRDAGIVQLPNGEVIVTWFTSTCFSTMRNEEYRNYFKKLTKRQVDEATGYFLMRSRDDGATWSKPEKLVNCDQTPHGPIVLKDGSLLQIGRRSAADRNAASRNTFDRTIISCSRSTDGGRTWKYLCDELPSEKGENDHPSRFHEPHVAELADGTLVGVIRYHGPEGENAQNHNGYMRVSFSKDGGHTWTPMTATPMLGLPPHLLVLPDGKLVCVYGRRLAKPGFGEFACISDDGGKTWDVKNEISLKPSFCGDLGYPASCLLANGDILTVYYQKPNEKEKPVLMATKWRIGSKSWAPAACPGSGSRMLTEWGEKVTPENAWREYPRPQMVRGNWQNLNGLWEYAITSNATYTSVSPWDKFEPCRELVQKGEILVPFAIETPLSGVGRLMEPSELLWYRRNLDVKKVPGRRLLLNFGAVDFRCQVFIGHHEVTDIPHEGGLVPFSVDITDFVKDGPNELILCVWDPTSQSLGAAGKQVFKPHECLYTRMSGVWQTVWTEQVPESYIENYRVVTDIDNGTVEIKLKVKGEGIKVKGKGEGEVSISIFDADNKKVGNLLRSPSPSPSSFAPSLTFTFSLPNAKLWSPEHPYLYRFTAKYGEDEVKGYFGMRKFEKRIDANGVLRFFLNNEPYFILGPLDQGWWPDGFLTPPSEAAMEFDIATLKKLGCNMMRKHMKDEPALYYYLCDKLGILIVQDMAAGGGDRNLRYGFYRREMKDMIDYLYNFPSIVMWCPFNENWGCQPGEFFTHNALDWVRRYDPTRLVNGPSGWDDYEGGDCHLKVDGKSKLVRAATKHKPFPQCEAADAVDMHFYRGPGMHAINPRRVSFLGEYGGLGQKVPGHIWLDDGKSWGYGGMDDTASRQGLTNTYLGLMDALASFAFRGLGGAVYTQTTDVEQELNGYLTYDRKVLKYDAEQLAAAHRHVLEMAKLGCNHKMITSKIFPKHDADPKAWAYTLTDPANGWERASFDDSEWKRSAAGFGNKLIAMHSEAKVVTEWNSKNLWLRRHFNYDGNGQKPLCATFEMFHDEKVTIYLNGVEILTRAGFNCKYEPIMVVGEKFASAIRNGDNVLAVKVEQTVAGQYFDTGLSIDVIK